MAFAEATARPISSSDEAYSTAGSTGVGPEYGRLQESLAESLRHFCEPYLWLKVDPFMRFLVLRTKWERETAHLSSALQMAMHPAYQQIIGMGSTAIPYLLAELSIRPDHWFWALAAITGDDPIRPENRGRIKKMAEDWLAWGRRKGYKV
jgi:hypothetical protein